MKTSLRRLFITILFYVPALNVFATIDGLQFKGQIIEGALDGYKFSGVCAFTKVIKESERTARCSLTATASDGQRTQLSDTNAYIAVEGDGHVLQVAMGLNPALTSAMGNRKLAAFTSTVFFDRPVRFDAPFPAFTAASVTLLGTTATGEDCLIYDMVGTSVRQHK